MVFIDKTRTRRSLILKQAPFRLFSSCLCVSRNSLSLSRERKSNLDIPPSFLLVSFTQTFPRNLYNTLFHRSNIQNVNIGAIGIQVVGKQLAKKKKIKLKNQKKCGTSGATAALDWRDVLFFFSKRPKQQGKCGAHTGKL